jgi:hypothetical protein
MSEQAVPAAWEVVLSTFERAEEWFVRWATEGQILPAQRDTIVPVLRERLEQARTLTAQNVEPPSIPGMLPMQADEQPAVRAYRLWRFLGYEVSQHKAAGRLTLSQAHALEEECRERLTSLKRRLAQDGVTLVMSPPAAASAPVPKSAADSGAQQFLDKLSQAEPAVPGRREVSNRMDALFGEAEVPTLQLAESPPKPRRNILEMLLDPRSIQWLMGIGGALMFVGLVILLYLNEWFTPLRMAIGMGAVNIAVMVAGWAAIRKSRYHTVGKGLTLLACLVMPLNLWFYHTHDLVTLDGHLWVVAVLISAFYAASAWVLKDEMFVYVFSAGVAMTGLLLLADMHKFMEIAAPATMLVVLGLAGIHTERAFGENDGPFSRKRFGLAFFASGHLLLGSGLVMLFIAQLAGDWLYEAWFKSVYLSMNAVPSPICGELRWLALVLVLAGTYGYIYSDIVVRKHGAYIHFAAALLLWAEVLIVQLLRLELGIDEIISVLAATSLVVNLTQAMVTRDQKLTRAFPAFGLLLTALPVLMGVYEYLHFLNPDLRSLRIGDAPRWSYVGAMALTAVAARLGAFIYRNSAKWLPTAYHFATAAAAMVGAVAALASFGFERWQEHAPIMMLIPIAYLVAAKLYGERGPSESLTWVAHTATIVMLISSLASAFMAFTRLDKDTSLNLALAGFFAEAAVYYGLATTFQRKPFCVHMTTLMSSASLWQMLLYFGITNANVYLLTFAGLGLALLLAYRFSVLEQTAAAPLTEAAFQAANSLLSLAFVSSAFKGLANLGADAFSNSSKVDWGFVGFSLTMLVIAALAVVIVKVAAWRRWYVVQVVAQAGLTLLALHKLINLTGWQQVELFSVIVGLLLLGVGHLGWYREQDRESDLVSTSLFFGSLLAVVPLAIATLIDRWNNHFLIANEAGFFIVTVLLMGSGLVFRLKSTTLVGTLGTIVYFLALAMFIRFGGLNTVAKIITFGGGTLFATGLILAFFRDRLLTLPERFKNREGLFKVLTWR